MYITYVHVGGTLGSTRRRSSRRHGLRRGILGLRSDSGRLRGRSSRSLCGRSSRIGSGTGRDERTRLALGLLHSRRRGWRRWVFPRLLFELTAIVTAILDAHVLLGAGQTVVLAVAIGERSFVPLTLAEACLLLLPVALALGTVGDVNVLVVLFAALGTAGLGTGIARLLAVVLLAARLDAGLLGGSIAVKTTVGLCGICGEEVGGGVKCGWVMEGNGKHVRAIVVTLSTKMSQQGAI